jgi:AraC-like DNA-binding protein
MSGALSSMSDRLDLPPACCCRLDRASWPIHLHRVSDPMRRVEGEAANDTRIEPTRSDPVRRALDLLASRPHQRWTVAALARAVGCSRAVLALRFTAEVGVPPLRHLTRLRMERAARRLVESDDGLAHIGADVGYATEFAFSKAFRRHHGAPPGAYRRAMRGDAITIRAAA